jgi:serine protease Do
MLAPSGKDGAVMQRLAWLILLILLALAPVFTPIPGAAQDLVPLFRTVSPSVGVIRAKGRDVTASGQIRFNETGSGVLISTDGRMMTAAHVVDAMDEISVEFLGGETVSARVIASESAADLSLLQLERMPKGAVVAKLANSDTIEVGRQVIIVGAPYGLSYSMSVGWISARWPPNTVYKTMPLAEFFQTDATINTGNSGGPMFDLSGEVIGIVSHNISKGGGSEGLGFVVTINTAKQLLLEKKSFWGGVEGQILSDEMADFLNLPAGTTGFLIKNVAKGSPADQMGLRGGTTFATIGGQQLVLGGDILLTVAGIPAGSAANLAKIRDLLGSAKPGTEFKGTILRAGRVLDLNGKVP